MDQPAVDGVSDAVRSPDATDGVDRLTSVVSATGHGDGTNDGDGSGTRPPSPDAASSDAALTSIAGLVASAVGDVRCRIDRNPDDPTDAQASWCQPIVSRTGERVAALVAEPTDRRRPTVHERRLLQVGADLAAAVLWQHRALEQAAHRDPLTLLPNRIALTRRLAQALDSPEEPPAVLFCGLDRFHVVNSSLGHTCGDQLLTAVAARLRTAVRQGDVVARFGGAEFVVMLTGEADGAVVRDTGRRLLRRVTAPFEIEGRRVTVTMSIGAVRCRRGDDAADVLRRAHAVAHRARTTTGDLVIETPDRVDDTALSQLDLESELRAAIDADALRVHFQPIVRTGNRQLSSVEALVRWQHPSRGLLRPDAFIPIAAEGGFLDDLDRWVIREAVRQVGALDDAAGIPAVSVNVTGLPLTRAAVRRWLLRTVRAAGLREDRLIVEVTEEMLARDPAATSHALDALRQAGVRIAVDDFGTGYSSLYRLKQLPVDELKIDRSFIVGLDEEPEAAVLFEAMVTMGHALGLHVVAEGVETSGQLADVKRLGADMAQGYLLCRPAPLAAVVETLRQASPSFTLPPNRSTLPA